MLAAVVQDPVVRLVGDQVDRVVCAVENIRQALQLVRREDAAARVVRRVDDDRPRSCGDVPFDRVDRQLKLRGFEVDANRLRAVGDDHRDVEEPRRRQVDHLVARVKDRAQRRGQAAECARCHRDISGIEVDPGQLAQRLHRDLDRLRVAELVGEPILVLRRRPFRERLLDLRQRHLLRVAELQVACLCAQGGVPGFALADKREHRLEVFDHRSHRRRVSAHANSPSRPFSVRPAAREEIAMYGSWP